MTSFVSVFYFDLTASNWFFFFRIIGTHIQCVLYAVNFVNMHCNRNIRSSDDERTNPIQNCNKCNFPSILCTSVGINLHTLVPGNVFFVNLVQFRKKSWNTWKCTYYTGTYKEDPQIWGLDWAFNNMAYLFEPADCNCCHDH